MANSTGFWWVGQDGNVYNQQSDGTADIAIGDYLSTFTTAEIVKKATAGETAIAIALEAFTTDASTGVLDALIIPPRTV